MKPNTAFVGTFHKTGTVLLGTIFGTLNAQKRIRLWRSDWQAKELQNWDVQFHYDSRFALPRHIADLPKDARVVISVRDPRDLLVSATRYHADSTEPWLHEPQARFDGRTYQEVLSALKTRDEKLLFELNHSSGNVIHRMLQVPWADHRILRVRLEDLMADRDLMQFEKLFTHLGMSGGLLEAALEAARRHSLFNAPARSHSHSRGGFAGEWQDRLSKEVAAAFEAKFPNAPSILGYED